MPSRFAAHPVVAQGGVALIAQLLAHGVPQVDQLVIELVQLGLVVLVPLALGLPGRQPPGVVGVGLEGGHLRQGVHAPLKGDLGGGQQLLILLGQIVLPLELRDDLRGEGFQLHLRVDKHQIPVLCGEVGPIRALEHGHGPGLDILLQLGLGPVPELGLCVIKRVPGVNAVADVGQRCQGLHMLLQLFLLQKDRLGLLIAPRRRQTPGQVAVPGLQRPQIRALIGHLRKLHDLAAFLLCRFLPLYI